MWLQLAAGVRRSDRPEKQWEGGGAVHMLVLGNQHSGWLSVCLTQPFRNGACQAGAATGDRRVLWWLAHCWHMRHIAVPGVVLAECCGGIAKPCGAGHNVEGGMLKGRTASGLSTTTRAAAELFVEEC